MDKQLYFRFYFELVGDCLFYDIGYEYKSINKKSSLEERMYLYDQILNFGLPIDVVIRCIENLSLSKL